MNQIASSWPQHTVALRFAGQVFHVLHRHVATVVLSVLARSAEDGEDVRARRCDGARSLALDRALCLSRVVVELVVA